MPEDTGRRRGKSLRERVPRSDHGAWEPAPDRPDPVRVLQEQAETRQPTLVPIRHGRMLTSPFAFYRGGAAIIAADLAGTPVSSLTVQLCGDAHLENFGGFAAPDRQLVFDVNDFDETLPGPWEWDLKRLAASFAVAGRDQGFGPDERAAAIRGAVSQYRVAMRGFAGMRTVDVWYARLELEQGLAQWAQVAGRARRKRLDKALEKARRKDSLRAFAKLAHDVEGRPRIVSDPPLIVPLDEMLNDAQRSAALEQLLALFARYRRSLPHYRRQLLDGYEPVDLAHKVVGVGSVGLQAWIGLLIGNGPDDPLFLQIKEAQPSVLERFARRSTFAGHGRRVVEGQRLMQAGSDVFLGWLQGPDAAPGGGRRHFYVRQLWDAKASVSVADLSAKELVSYAGICGWTLARAHARTGDRAAIASYLGSSDRFDRALVAFAEAYADQNERDFEAFSAAVRAGRIAAETGL